MQGDVAPVEVKNHDPIDVAVVEAAGAEVARTVKARAGVDAAILRTEDQRRISGIWERTQQVIALAVVLDTLLVVSFLVLAPMLLALAGVEPDDAAKTAAVGGLLFLTAVSNLVIGFYFGRTNHQRVGGIGGDEVAGR